MHDLSMGGGHDLAMSMDDLSMPGGDMSVPDAASPDLSGDDGGGGCTVVPTWPGLNLAGGFVDGAFPVTFVLSTDQASGPYGLLEVDDYHQAGETFPNVTTLMPTDTFQSCSTCVLFNDACADQMTCFNGFDYNFFGVGGTVTIDQADSDPATGRMKASFTNLKLVEWDFLGTDQPVPGGRCIIIQAGALDVTWNNNTGDGGTGDGGTTPTTNSLWMQGDFITNNVTQLGRVTSSDGMEHTIALGTQVNAFDVAPNGTTIVVGADVTTAGRFDLYSANADGTGATLLAAMTNTGVSSLKISPDGTKVAFIADIAGAGVRDVWMVPITGGTPVKLSPARSAAGSTALQPAQFSWSLDSKYVAIQGDYNTDRMNQLFITDTTAGTPAAVTVTPAAGCPTPGATGTTCVSTALPPIWASTGKAFFKAQMGTDTGFTLYTVDPAGTNLGPLPNFPALPVQLGSYGVSPDGTQLAFSADSVANANAYEVFVMPSSGASAPVLRTSGTLMAAAGTNRGTDFGQLLYWSPDATRIAYAGDVLVDNRFEAYVVTVTGAVSQIHVATVGTAGDANRDIQQIAWKPDSSTIAFIADHRVDNDFEVFTIPDVVTADQTPVLVQGVPTSGDMANIKWTAP